MKWASSSPRSRLRSCSSNRSRWSTGSFSSENALAISRPRTISSNRSTISGRSPLRRESGETSIGYSVTKVGPTIFLSATSS